MKMWTGAVCVGVSMRGRIERAIAAAALMAVTSVAGAQSASGPDTREAALQHKQRQAGAAFSELQKVQYEAKLAEQDFLNAQDAHASTPSEERRQQLENAKKALAVAQAKVEQARKRFDDAVAAV